MTIECPKCQTDNPDRKKFCGDCGTPLETYVIHTKTLETTTEEPRRRIVFAGRHEIIKELDKGGIGKVYRIENTKLNDEMSLKPLRPERVSFHHNLHRS